MDCEMDFVHRGRRFRLCCRDFNHAPCYRYMWQLYVWEAGEPRWKVLDGYIDPRGGVVDVMELEDVPAGLAEAVEFQLDHLLEAT